MSSGACAKPSGHPSAWSHCWCQPPRASSKRSSLPCHWRPTCPLLRSKTERLQFELVSSAAPSLGSQFSHWHASWYTHPVCPYHIHPSTPGEELPTYCFSSFLRFVPRRNRQELHWCHPTALSHILLLSGVSHCVKVLTHWRFFKQPSLFYRSSKAFFSSMVIWL